MIARLRYAARLVASGPVSAALYLATEAYEWLGVVMVPKEDIDAYAAEAEPEADPAGHPAAALTGLDAETWVNRLRADYHAADDDLDAPNCGNWDCLHCWVNATGATG